MSEALSLSVCQHCGAQVSPGESFCCSACAHLHNRFNEAAVHVDSELLFLDQPNFRELYRHPESEYQYQLYVEGLHCSSCVHLLEKIPDFDDSVLEARVQFAQSRLALRTNENFSLARLASLLKSWGYSPRFLKTSESNDKAILTENRAALMRLGVAGACAGNIMLFVIPIYGGLAGTWQDIFNWMSFVLFLPILFYSSTSFYKGAWNSLRYQTVNVDLPITIALWSGFLLSTLNLLRGNGHIYYDSTASFIFLILCARYLLKRVQQNFLASFTLQDLIQDEKFLKKQNDTWLPVPLSDLHEGDLVQLQKSQNNPADGVLVSADALVDLSILNGESLPRRFHRGMEILAGSKILSAECEIEVKRSPQKSRLAALLKELEEGTWNKSDFVTLTDSLAQKLIITVFALAVLFFAFYFTKDSQEAFNRALALIVLACPCALAFGSPLTLGLALKKAQQKGILIKNANSLEKILKVKNIFFDKTGTLTDIDLRFVSSAPAVLDTSLLKIILGLEQSSYHPVAFAIRKTWPDIVPAEVKDLHEKLGQGVSGHFEGHFFELKTLSESLHESALGLVLLKDGHALARLYFEDPLRPDASACVQKLKQLGYQCFLLSGDRRERVLAVAENCKIESQNAFYELFPEDKKDILVRHPHSCMIGDGANDSLSLKAADVGIAVKGSVNLSLQAADIYFNRGGLQPFLDLLNLARQARHVLVRNLSLSLIYNVIGAVLALSGFISPWLAAVLMPVSSILIIISTLWGFR